MNPKRILLKLSGEILKGMQDNGIHPGALHELASSLKNLRTTGIQIAVVIGGGNFFRGIQSKHMQIHQPPADYMGMLATMINGIAIQQALDSLGCPAHVMSGLECPKAVEPYNWYKACRYLEQNEIVIFIGGTGNPYFTTDTAAGLRASEIEADLLLKATKVEGVFDKDPIQHIDAKKYSSLSYSDFLARKLAVMDATAITLCQKSGIPILVFQMELLLKEKTTDINQLQQLGTLIN